MAMQHWDLARVAVTRRLCRCDEIECGRCTLPWRPPAQRTRRELIEDLNDSDESRDELREKLQQYERVLEVLVERMEVIRGLADPKREVNIHWHGEKKEDAPCPE